MITHDLAVSWQERVPCCARSCRRRAGEVVAKRRQLRRSGEGRCKLSPMWASMLHLSNTSNSNDLSLTRTAGLTVMYALCGRCGAVLRDWIARYPSRPGSIDVDGRVGRIRGVEVRPGVEVELRHWIKVRPGAEVELRHWVGIRYLVGWVCQSLSFVTQRARLTHVAPRVCDLGNPSEHTPNDLSGPSRRP